MSPALNYSPGKLVHVRGREWVVQPSEDPDLLVLKPLGGSDEETTGIYLPLEMEGDEIRDAEFPIPCSDDLGDFTTARLLLDASRLSFRNGSGPFRSLGKLSFRPRSYQIVPLVMALRQGLPRLIIGDDVGVGKTIEALLIIKELIERRIIKRFAILCLPHLCDQWEMEVRDKLGIEAAVIRSGTQARLDREIQGDTSVYDYYPFQIISIDYIKSETRREVFIQQCPELVIVDEAHTCTRPAGANRSQQLRHFLVSRISEKENQGLVLMTATPHSGKPAEFQSLLGLIREEFEELDVPNSNQEQRRSLARHFVQRQRGDILKHWSGERLFPTRESEEANYALSDQFLGFFDDLLGFARGIVGKDEQNKGRYVRYWTALGLMRGCMSSPYAGMSMLQSRLDKLSLEEDSFGKDDANPVHDLEFGFDSDSTPVEVLSANEWTESEKRKLRELAKQLETLANPTHDHKFAALNKLLDGWVRSGFNVVVFCKYIDTAKYVGEKLQECLKISKLNVQVVTSEDHDEVRRDRIDAMDSSDKRILVCTDCLSEGINLHNLFTAVVHYDLPWNPNRLEQREGRVDRFGQVSPTVKATLLYSSDNPIDGIVLDVILRKVREIRRATGVNVPFPENSESVIDTITKALLLNPNRKISTRQEADQTYLDFEEFDEAKKLDIEITDKLNKAAARAKARRTIFAQHSIKAEEIEGDLREMDEALGDPSAVRDFVVSALNVLVGSRISESKEGYELETVNLSHSLLECLPGQSQPPIIQVSFDSPTPEGHLYLGRNHPFVEELCRTVLAHSVSREDGGASARAARASVIKCKEVSIKTTLLLFRCRNVIERRDKSAQIVAEEMLLWGFRGSPSDKQFIDSQESRKLLDNASPTSDLSPPARKQFISDEVERLEDLREQFDIVAEERCQRLVEAHERYGKLVENKRFQVVYPVLPMDVLGVYVLLPE